MTSRLQIRFPSPCRSVGALFGFVVAVSGVACAAPTDELAARGESSLSADAPFLPPAAVEPPPHVDASGAAVGSLRLALEDALAALQLPVAASGETYELRSMSCRWLRTPNEPGPGCGLDYRIGAGAWTAARIERPGPAARLYDVLLDLHARPFVDPVHGEFIRLTSVTVSADRASFDDVSNYFPPTDPNVAVTGAPAQALLDAFGTAGVRDTDHRLQAYCNAFSATPACGWALVRQDGFGTTTGSGVFSAGDAARVWEAFRGVATAGGLDASHATIFNGRSFSFDGTTVRLFLVVSSATPPPDQH